MEISELKYLKLPAYIQIKDIPPALLVVAEAFFKELFSEDSISTDGYKDRLISCHPSVEFCPIDNYILVTWHECDYTIECVVDINEARVLTTDSTSEYRRALKDPGFSDLEDEHLYELFSSVNHKEAADYIEDMWHSCHRQWG